MIDLVGFDLVDLILHDLVGLVELQACACSVLPATMLPFALAPLSCILVGASIQSGVNSTLVEFHCQIHLIRLLCPLQRGEIKEKRRREEQSQCWLTRKICVSCNWNPRTVSSVQEARISINRGAVHRLFV